MSTRQISRQALIDALSRAENKRASEFLAAIESQGRSDYKVTNSPAAILRKTLAVRYASLHERGRVLDGDTELLARLELLGNEPVVGVALDVGERHLSLFMQSMTLDPIGVVGYERGIEQ